MATAIDLASNALVLIGDNPINSFTEPGGGATAAANLYDDTYAAFLSMHPWTFALKEQSLSRLTASPDPRTNYKYAFQVPADHIRTWSIMPYSNYVVVGELIYSNQPALLMRYVYKVNETQLPAHAIKCIEYLLASDFAQIVTESTSKSDYFAGKARLALASAMAIDSQGHPQQRIIDSPFTDVRNGGSPRFS